MFVELTTGSGVAVIVVLEMVEVDVVELARVPLITEDKGTGATELVELAERVALPVMLAVVLIEVIFAESELEEVGSELVEVVLVLKVVAVGELLLVLGVVNVVKVEGGSVVVEVLAVLGTSLLVVVAMSVEEESDETYEEPEVIESDEVVVLALGTLEDVLRVALGVVELDVVEVDGGSLELLEEIKLLVVVGLIDVDELELSDVGDELKVLVDGVPIVVVLETGLLVLEMLSVEEFAVVIDELGLELAVLVVEDVGSELDDDDDIGDVPVDVLLLLEVGSAELVEDVTSELLVVVWLLELELV